MIDLRPIREKADEFRSSEDHINGHEAAGIIDELVDEIDRIRKLHQEEQRRSADRLKEALEKERGDTP